MVQLNALPTKPPSPNPPSWRVFSNPTRNTIIELLSEKERTTGELCTHFEQSRFAVMQHLKVLEKAGVVSAEKRGRYRWNHLNQEKLDQLKAENRVKPLIKSIVQNRMAQPTIEMDVDFEAKPAAVFKAITQHVDCWWTDSPDAEYPIVKLEPHVGGRFFNRLDADGSGILYATIDQIKQNELLGMTGNMGSDSTISIIRFRLAAVGPHATRLNLQHRFIGEIDLASYEAFQQSWQQLLLMRLKFFIEKNASF